MKDEERVWELRRKGVDIEDVGGSLWYVVGVVTRCETSFEKGQLSREG